ncbi:helix-turn-helix domain-containing protein [Chitinophaga filiformis]|uniref:Helix-turn-helix domain-containing protein n=1 Tax=Chitinophaga filiformis TaxID=104663 RepID=A0ABY4HY26_CHIFI|nr:helix-turn-helix domain-containing protein [Chitinophaga filiformis]UPK67934.1 helix-turn-helix domain-containing protein [Chitinophaga filiformis]
MGELTNDPKGTGGLLVPWVTLEDLKRFKIELLEEILQLLGKSHNEEPKKWLKTYEVRKLLNVSAGTLQTLRLNGTLPYTKLGGALYYDYKDIERLLDKEKRNLRNPRK